MELIVADANIFVYLFRCNLHITFLSNEFYSIKITRAVANELTDTNKRIAREHPDLRRFINDAIHNTTNVTLEVFDINQHIQNPESLFCYYHLSEEAELDAGEIESIPLALELNARFLSNDIDAIDKANKFRNNLAIQFQNDFCHEMLGKQIITDHDFKLIQEILS